MPKRTKIICTIGPSSETQAVLEKMLRSGMNIARLNFSHGTHEHHKMLIKNIRAAAKKTGKIVTILQDLQGPKIRVGKLSKEIDLSSGEKITLTPERPSPLTLPPKPRGQGIIPITYFNLHRVLRPGDRVFLSDGKIELRVEKIKGKNIECKVVIGGTVRSGKGVNLPGASLGISSLTPKDKKDLHFGLLQGIDWVALSFVRAAKDILELKRIIKKSGSPVLPKIIAKIEKPEAVQNFDKILSAADGIMVARGDLGIEISGEKVPVVQKQMIEKCLEVCKPVVVATQMLASMERNFQPTRAEISDVANAVIDHTDAVMLSEETAAGRYPVRTVATMARIIEETEKSKFDDLKLSSISSLPPHPLKEYLGEAAGLAARHLDIQAVVALGNGESVAQKISCFRPELPVVAVVEQSALARQINLGWGITPFVTRTKNISRLLPLIQKRKIIKRGDKVLIIRGNKEIIVQKV